MRDVRTLKLMVVIDEFTRRRLAIHVARRIRSKEAQVVIEHWRNHYNTRRPHSALGYRPPAPEVAIGKGNREVMETGLIAA
jgi:hypothetical protein